MRTLYAVLSGSAGDVSKRDAWLEPRCATIRRDPAKLARAIGTNGNAQSVRATMPADPREVRCSGHQLVGLRRIV